MTGPTIDVAAITAAPMEVGGTSTVPVGSDPLKRDPIYDQRLGIIGGLVGGGSEKPGNIAVLAIILGVALILIGSIGLFNVVNPATLETFKLIIASAFSLITGALGFVFGQGNSRNHD